MLRDEQRIPESVAIDYATQIAAGLAFAHRQGLLHRDVKPANILVTRDDVVKLGDFGIARAVAENAIGVTQPGMVMGSVAYVSPEQAQGRELDARSDLYSLGVVLYQMVTGRLPFNGETPVAVALKHVSEPAPALDRRVRREPGARLDHRDAAAERSRRPLRVGDRIGARAARSARAARLERRRAAPRRCSDGDARGAARATAAAARLGRARSAAANGAATFEEEPLPPVFDRRWVPFIALLVHRRAVRRISRRARARPAQAISRWRDFADREFDASPAVAGRGRACAREVQLEASETRSDRSRHPSGPGAGTQGRARRDGDAVRVERTAAGRRFPTSRASRSADAEHTLADAKFRTKIAQRFDDTAPKDTVLDVSPADRRQADAKAARLP